MDALKEYVFILIISALICSILLSAFPVGIMRSLLKFIFSVFFTITSISPLINYKIPDWSEISNTYLDSGRHAVDFGKNMAEEEQSRLIKAGLTSYILDRAANMGYEITADFKINHQGVPSSVLLEGDIPLSVRKKITDIITKDLGIPEEDQKWTGEYGKN